MTVVTRETRIYDMTKLKPDSLKSQVCGDCSGFCQRPAVQSPVSSGENPITPTTPRYGRHSQQPSPRESVRNGTTEVDSANRCRHSIQTLGGSEQPCPRKQRWHDHNLAWLLVPLVGLILGVNFVTLSLALDSAGPLTLSAFGGMAGSCGMFALAAATGQPIVLPLKTLKTILPIGLCLGVIGQLGVILALERIDASTVSLLMSTTPIVTAIIAWTVLGERASWLAVSGTLLAFGGVAIVVGPPGTEEWGTSWLGVLFVLMAATGWAVGLVMTNRLGRQVPTITLVAWQTLIAVPVFLFAAGVGEGFVLSPTPLLLAIILYNGIVARGISFIIQRHLMLHGSTLHASLTAYAVPFFGNLLAVPVLGEVITSNDLSGSAAVVTGLTIVIAAGPIRSQRHRARQEKGCL